MRPDFIRETQALIDYVDAEIEPMSVPRGIIMVPQESRTIMVYRPAPAVT